MKPQPWHRSSDLLVSEICYTKTAVSGAVKGSASFLAFIFSCHIARADQVQFATTLIVLNKLVVKKVLKKLRTKNVGLDFCAAHKNAIQFY